MPPVYFLWKFSGSFIRIKISECNRGILNPILTGIFECIMQTDRI